MNATETIRNVKPIEQVNNEFSIDRNNLLPSLLDSISNIPMGSSYFSYDEETGRLSQLSGDVEKSQHEIQSIAFERHDDRIAITSAEYVRLGEKPHEMVIEFTPEGYLQYISFKNSIRYEPHLSLTFIHDGAAFKSQAYLYMSLISNIASLTPRYTGDHKTVSFDKLANYTPEQLSLVFADGNVPDIDIQAFMHDTLFLKNLRAKNSIALPTLTFMPEKNDYQRLLSHTYLVNREDHLPAAEAGKSLEGIVIIDASDKPYSIRVAIEHIEEKPHMYGQIEDVATYIDGAITISDGKQEITVQKPFIALYTIDYVRNNPQSILGSAFTSVIEELSATYKSL